MSSLSIKNFSSSFLRSFSAEEEIFLPKKIEISLLGRFMRETREEYPCRLQEISLYELSLLSSVKPKVGEKVVCLIDRIGLLEGYVETRIDAGFVLSLNLTSRGRKLLTARLERACRKDNQDVTANVFKNSSLSLSNWSDESDSGKEKNTCCVEDLSLFGAFLLTQARPPLGSEIFLNQMRSRVEHHHADGISVSFIDITNPKAFRRHFEKHN